MRVLYTILFTETAHSVKKFGIPSFILLLVLLFQTDIVSQSRVYYAGKDAFLSGINAAWVSFASDLGPNPVNLSQFRTEFQTIRDNGGNAIRLWLFTNGSNTPQYNSEGYVTGPGIVAIKNLKQILALAHHYNIGLVLCLWSFDMLRKTELDSAKLFANQKMLTDTVYTEAFIKNALVPMVDSVKGDSAIIAWEVCNEPNGMTTGMNYYPGDPTVSQHAIQQFTNLIAGAIHRADKNALVTIGPGSFQTLTDVNVVAKISAQQSISNLSAEQLQSIADRFNAAHRYPLTLQQMKNYLMKIAAIPDSNYYRDDRLIAAGGDSLGTLNFYCVHYYSYGAASMALSPFSHPFSYWDLKKPTVVAEFYMEETDGITDNNLYPNLYNKGYAGALAWSWTDFPNTPNNKINAAKDTWAALQFMKTNFKQDIDIFNTDFPTISITSPKDSASFTNNNAITITAAVKDTGSSIAYVEFFSSDSSLGKVLTPSDSSSDTLFYSFTINNISAGMYTISALAQNGFGQQEISASIRITYGTVSMTRLEAEDAILNGAGMSIVKDPTASGGEYVDVKTNDSTATITWKFVNSSTAGTYPIGIGFKLGYDSPKSQYLNINGARSDTVVFSGSTSTWLEKTVNVYLKQDTNTVQMQMFWGWMYVDYLAVPSSIITSVKTSKEIPLAYSLSQNYPNPFNPATTIDYRISKDSYVTLKIYNILGQTVKTLVDKEQQPGDYTVRFDAYDFASGVYFYSLKAGSFFQTKKMMILK